MPSAGAIAMKPRMAQEWDSSTKLRTGASLLGHEGRASECGWLMKTDTPHWPIDYLLGVAEPVEGWYNGNIEIGASLC